MAERERVTCFMFVIGPVSRQGLHQLTQTSKKPSPSSLHATSQDLHKRPPPPGPCGPQRAENIPNALSHPLDHSLACCAQRVILETEARPPPCRRDPQPVKNFTNALRLGVSSPAEPPVLSRLRDSLLESWWGLRPAPGPNETRAGCLPPATPLGLASTSESALRRVPASSLPSRPATSQELHRHDGACWGLRPFRLQRDQPQ